MSVVRKEDVTGPVVRIDTSDPNGGEGWMNNIRRDPAKATFATDGAVITDEKRKTKK